MFDTWKLQDYAPGEGARSGAASETCDDSAWLPVRVPGDVHSALLAAGRIKDPFYDQNETECAWLQEREWWYRLCVAGPDKPLQPGERLRLIFHGLDTFAVVYLNGKELGKTSNMFREHAFDVTARGAQQHAGCALRPSS
jgi:beta-mannosidase